METSEQDEPQENPIPPVEPDSPLAAATPEPVPEVAPLEPAEPGLYWCEDEYSGSHPVLQQTIHQGENDLSAMTNPEELRAVAALVRDGVLQGPM